jgi:hypothetical protein
MNVFAAELGSYLIFSEVECRSIAMIDAMKHIVSEVALTHAKFGKQLNSGPNQKGEKDVHVKDVARTLPKSTEEKDTWIPSTRDFTNKPVAQQDENAAGEKND